MSRVAQLAVAAAVYAIDRPYSYRVPEDMPLAAGMRVLVPFGHGNRRTEGIVLSVQEGVAAGLKAVEQMLDDASILTGGQLRLAAPEFAMPGGSLSCAPDTSISVRFSSNHNPAGRMALTAS